MQPKSPRSQSLHFLTALILCTVVLALSTPPTATAEPGRPGMDFALHFQNTKMNWQYSQSTQHTRVTRLGIVWQEYLARYLQGGLMFGALEVSQADNPINSLGKSSGEYFGLQINGDILEHGPIRLGLFASYSYNKSDAEENDQSIEFVWYQTEFGLKGSWEFAPRLRLLFGATRYWIDGEERLQGPLSRLTTYRQAGSLNYLAGLDFKTNLSGSIGVQWLFKDRDGVHIYFRRTF